MPSPRCEESVTKFQRYRSPGGTMKRIRNSPISASRVATHPQETGAPLQQATYARCPSAKRRSMSVTLVPWSRAITIGSVSRRTESCGTDSIAGTKSSRRRSASAIVGSSSEQYRFIGTAACPPPALSSGRSGAQPTDGARSVRGAAASTRCGRTERWERCCNARAPDPTW